MSDSGEPAEADKPDLPDEPDEPVEPLEPIELEEPRAVEKRASLDSDFDKADLGSAEGAERNSQAHDLSDLEKSLSKVDSQPDLQEVGELDEDDSHEISIIGGAL